MFQQYQFSLNNTPIMVTLMNPDIVVLTPHDSFKGTQIDYFKVGDDQFEVVANRTAITITKNTNEEQEIIAWNKAFRITEIVFARHWLKSYNMGDK